MAYLPGGIKQLLSFLLLYPFLITLASCQHSLAINCLPESRKLTDVVTTDGIAAKPEEADKIKKVTIADQLTDLKASCENNLLVDGSGKEIRFYQLTGCWGAAPANYQKTLAHQRAEIEALQAEYTVISMTCNPEGIPFP